MLRNFSTGMSIFTEAVPLTMTSPPKESYGELDCAERGGVKLPETDTPGDEGVRLGEENVESFSRRASQGPAPCGSNMRKEPTPPMKNRSAMFDPRTTEELDVGVDV